MAVEINPFSITKAVHFSDDEIANFWVQIWENEDPEIEKMLNPLDLTPKYILGGKGCGKTHLLRYYSYPLQKIRNKQNFHELISNEKYIGIYYLLGGLNSFRFQGKGYEEYVWQDIFNYYLELVIAQKSLSILNEIFSSLKVDPTIEEKVCFQILDLFDLIDPIKIANLNDLIEYIKKLQKQIDFEVNNSALTRKLENGRITIRISLGALILGIPKIISNNIPQLKNVTFLYLLDELEKLSDNQKKLINTLVWEKTNPSTFWIGARYYGFKVFKTYNDEELREGGEYEKIRLDQILRKNDKNYKRFATELCENRLKKIFENKQSISQFFEKQNDDNDLNKIAETKNIQFESDLRRKLNEGLQKQILNGVKTEFEIDKIIQNLAVNDNIIYQKYNYLLFYKDWSSKENLLESSLSIKSDYLKFSINKEDTSTRHFEVNDKFKKDLIAQLYKDFKERIPYSGIDTFIELSWGNPRSLLTILKRVYKWSIFNDEKPFVGLNKISLSSQSKGVYEASQIIYEEVEATGVDFENLNVSITNLAEIFRAVRFSDKITESSPSSFYVNESELSPASRKTIKIAKDHSFLIEIEDGRHDKNNERKSKLYQINRILCPKWELPLYRRGTLKLKLPILESIFNPEKFSNFKFEYDEFLSIRNAPLFGNKKTNRNIDFPLIPGLEQHEQ